jgi:hypothetical protein
VPPRKACCWNYNGSTGAGEPREPEAGGVPATQLLAAKVSDPEFWGNVRKFRRHFKGLFLIGNVRVRILPGQPAILVFREFPSFDEKGPQNVGFSHRRLSLETGSRTFWAENSQKSPAEFKKTPVFWRLASETEE